MSQGAYSVHREIRQELENYIKTQYFGKSPLLFTALKEKLGKEGVLYREPYIESLPAYKQVSSGFEDANIEDWLKDFFSDLIQADLGVFATPFTHQKNALELTSAGQDIFVSTGTGSGKTECFMWPIVAKLAKEAKFSKSWDQRGIRVMIMYPMNALVSDQLGRLRNLLGDAKGDFIKTFRKSAGKSVRRPSFGMYTGRTPYPGPQPRRANDKRLAETFSKMLMPDDDDTQAMEYYQTLLKEGRIPAKEDLGAFIERLCNSEHIPDDEDAELLTRFEMQRFCPDILITNYSMLEYMLFRPREAKIWDDTKKWLQEDENNRLLFVIDEAHMYRGSSGGEVALLIRRLLHKLEINTDRVQFILTTASMPNESPEDCDAVKAFAHNLTGKNQYHYLFGEREVLNDTATKPLAYVEPSADIIGKIETVDTSVEGLNEYWKLATNGKVSFTDLESAQFWLYNHLTEYEPFNRLISACRGSAISISDLAKSIYPGVSETDGVNAVSLLISIAQLAKNDKGAVLFPAKMHLLFRGLRGVFACTNPNCNHSHSYDGVELGEILIDENGFVCPECGSVVYELYQDRRCGALFFKGYIVEDEKNSGRAYLWHYSGQLLERSMLELHLFIPPNDFVVPRTRSGNQIKPCYMNMRNGFIDFRDDKHKDDNDYRKLYYSEYIASDVPDLMTFTTCPHCKKSMSRLRLSSFATRGNQSFNNLIKAQFNSQDPVPNRLKDPFKYPNEGRKVLMFSDSRQRAATLARDMTSEANIAAARQLFMGALSVMSKQDKELSLDESYGFFLHEGIKNNVPAFDPKFKEDCDRIRAEEQRNQRRSSRRKREPNLSQYTVSNNAGEVVQEQLMRLYCDNYNTLIQDALSWIEPMDDVLEDLVEDIAEGLNITIDDDVEYEALEQKVLEVFNAWFIDICDTNQAIGPTIRNVVRNRVRKNFKEGFGLKSDWDFSTVIKQINGWADDSQEKGAYRKSFHRQFLEGSNDANDAYFVKLDKIKPIYDPRHQWYRCDKCAEISPLLLRGKCPSCGSDAIRPMIDEDYDALAFWRKPAEDAIEGKRVRVIDTEEHTAQLSHKDQQDDMWSKTEEYEMRFQDMIKADETPVDILSSTTTMEVGIDIGSLVAVGLRNIPPMRENYQQRAGRAGRRGSSLSTIVTFCENGPYDTLYFNKPVPMFRGEPRRPWIDTKSKKLLQRHLNIIALQSYIASVHGCGLDDLPTVTFIDDYKSGTFGKYLKNVEFSDADMLLGADNLSVLDGYKEALLEDIGKLDKKCTEHPELYIGSDVAPEKSILDALYEEGVIPTYSFPKDVISLYVNNYRERRPKIEYQVGRGLNVAIGEYAPGRSVVVDKKTFQIGGLYFPGTEIRNPQSPASSFVNDPNYNKDVISCTACGWFDIYRREVSKCPFCGSIDIKHELPMLKPWGFAPKDGRAYSNAQIDEEYSAAKEPLYSTLPTAEEMESVSNFHNIRKASRPDQSIIMMNKGPADAGFTLCTDCGAIMPAEKDQPLKRVFRPYKINGADNRCSHANSTDVNLGYEMKTDMLVLEFKLDKTVINTSINNLWLTRAGASLSEAIRLIAGEKLDIEFTELVTGFRIRNGREYTYVDIYIYDSLSSGAGYSDHLSSLIDELLVDTLHMLEGCSCDSACYDCLKHYRNQHLHGKLNRHAAADLLKWGMNSVLPSDISLSEQWDLLRPVVNVLEEYGLTIIRTDRNLHINNGRDEKAIVIYPAMKKTITQHNEIHISDYMLKYARPTAVEHILNSINQR